MSKAKLQRDSQNFPIQGTAASMTKLAGIMLYRRQVKENSFNKFKMVLNIHDEIVLESKRDFARESAKQLQECMLSAGKVFVKNIPMEAEVKISNYWTH